MSSPARLRVGLFAIGLEAYWSQFEGLQQQLNDYAAQLAQRLGRTGVEIVNLGLIDTPEKAVDAGHAFRRADVDLIFLHVTTYALSSTVLPVVRRAKVPVIILNLSPGAAIDYASFNAMADRTKMTGEWLAWCQACPVPEIANVFNRCSIPFFQITGMLERRPRGWDEIDDWIEAARVAHIDGAQPPRRDGPLLRRHARHLLRPHPAVRHLRRTHRNRRSRRARPIACRRLAASTLECRVAPLPRRLRRPARLLRPRNSHAPRARPSRSTSLVERHRLGSLAYYYMGTGNPANEDAISSIILGTSLLTARGMPVAGECEIKNAQAMKIMDSFGVGGSFTEYYAMDFKDDIVLMGHDGPGHLAIAEGKTKVRPLQVYHGKVGRGLVGRNVRQARPSHPAVGGADVRGRLKLLAAEAESVPGPILEIGNTNSRYRFRIGARQFINAWNAQGPAHHCAVGVGHIAAKIEKLGALLNIETVRIG